MIGLISLGKSLYEGPTENRLGELGSLYKYYYYYYYYYIISGATRFFLLT